MVKKKILIAEDQQDTAEFLGRILKRRGHEVNIASDGLQAKDFIDSRQFDILFLDCSIPGMTGFELVKYAREHNPAARIIVFTGYNIIDEKLAEDLGADEFLRKPINPEEIEKICDY